MYKSYSSIMSGFEVVVRQYVHLRCLCANQEAVSKDA